MTNKYLTQIEKRSSLSLAAFMHAGQNVATNSGIKSGLLGKHIARGLSEGYHGVNAGLKDKLKASAVGLISPEASALRVKARQAGELLRAKTIGVGQPLTRREMAVGRMISQGRISEANRFMPKAPRAGQLASELGDRHGIPIREMLGQKGATSKNVEAAFKDKSTPFLSNNVSKIVDQTENLANKTSKVVKPGKWAYRSMALANGAVAALDPVTAGINVGKTALMGTIGKDHPGMKKVRHLFEKHFVEEPATTAFKAGLSGEVKPNGLASKAKAIFNRFGVNAMSSHLSDAAGKVGAASRADALENLNKLKRN